MILEKAQPSDPELVMPDNRQVILGFLPQKRFQAWSICQIKGSNTGMVQRTEADI